jgi:hypothetical protein
MRMKECMCVRVHSGGRVGGRAGGRARAGVHVRACAFVCAGLEPANACVRARARAMGAPILDGLC